MRRKAPEKSAVRLSERGRQLIDGLLDEVELGADKPKYSFDEIMNKLRDTTGEAVSSDELLRRNRARLEQGKRFARLVVQRQEFARAASEALGVGDRAADLERMLDAALYGNDLDLREIDPEKILRLRLARDRTVLAEKKLAREERKLDLETQRLQLDVTRLKRKLKEQRRDEKRKKADTERALAAISSGGDRAESARQAIREIWGLRKAPNAAGGARPVQIADSGLQPADSETTQ